MGTKPTLREINATQFLLSLRSSYLKGNMFPPEYITFYVSPTVFKDYMRETEATARILPNDIPPEYRQVRYLVRGIRVRESIGLHGLETTVKEGRYHWESM